MACIQMSKNVNWENQPIAHRAIIFTRRPLNPTQKTHIGLNSNELDSSVSQNPNSTQHHKFWRPIQSQRPADPAPSPSPTTSHPVPRSWMVCHRRPTSFAVPTSDPCICLCACRHPCPPFCITINHLQGPQAFPSPLRHFSSPTFSSLLPPFQSFRHSQVHASIRS